MQILATLPAAVLLLATGAFGGALGAWLWGARRARIALEYTLAGELVSLRWQAVLLANEIARRHDAGEAWDERFFALWPLTEPLIYPATGAATLARLPREARVRLGYFHGQLAGARARLAQARAAGGFEPGPYRILSALVRSHYEVDPWVRRLRRGHDAVFPWDDPDVGPANDLLGRLEAHPEEPIAIAYGWADCAHPPDEP